MWLLSPLIFYQTCWPLFNFVVMKSPVLICGHQEGGFCYPKGWMRRVIARGEELQLNVRY